MRSRLCGNRGPTYVRANSAASPSVRTVTSRARRRGGSNTKSVMPRKLARHNRSSGGARSHPNVGQEIQFRHYFEATSSRWREGQSALGRDRVSRRHLQDFQRKSPAEMGLRLWMTRWRRDVVSSIITNLPAPVWFRSGGNKTTLGGLRGRCNEIVSRASTLRACRGGDSPGRASIARSRNQTRVPLALLCKLNDLLGDDLYCEVLTNQHPSIRSGRGRAHGPMSRRQAAKPGRTGCGTSGPPVSCHRTVTSPWAVLHVTRTRPLEVESAPYVAALVASS
jgi:hypothetical protein